MYRTFATLAISGLLLSGCAELNKLAALVQAPRFEQDPDHRAEIRMSRGGRGYRSGEPAFVSGRA